MSATHRGLDGAGADRVDADASRGVLERGAAGEAEHAVFGGVVGGAPRQADEAAQRGAVDDRAVALRSHLRELVLHAGPDAAQVDCVDAVEELGRLVGGVGRRCLDPGVVERHVDSPEPLHRLLNERADLLSPTAAEDERRVGQGAEISSRCRIPAGPRDCRRA
jgi:hypothetical protein